MKVIIANRYFFPDESASSRLVSSLALALARRGLTVEVLTGRRLHDDASRVLQAFETVGSVRVHRQWTTGYGRGRLAGRVVDDVAFHLATMARLLSLARPGDVCIVCTDPPLLAASTLMASTLRGAALVNWILDLYPEIAMDLGVVGRGSLLAHAALFLRNVTLRRARMNVALTRRMASHLASLGIPGATLSVVPPWSDGEAIRPLPSTASSARREWGLTGRFVVGYSGNLGRAHEFETILNAAERLSHRVDIVFLFVGGGHRRAWVKAEVQRRRLANVVMKPLQPRERLSDTMAAADAHLVSLLPAMEPYIVPSKFHGILAAGRPTLFIGAPDGEVATAVRAAGCGTALAIGDADGLARWIVTLADNPMRVQEMGARARRLFDDTYTEARGVAAWTELILSLAPSLRDVPASASQYP